MAATSLLSLDQYLNTSFHPDKEFVDGELRERHVGSYEHARLQALITAWFIQNESEWGIQCVVEQRTRTSQTNVLIPDVALIPKGPQPRVLVEAPLLAVEILSPEDRYSELTLKIRKYLDWGVRAVWIVDPESPSGQVWTAPYICTIGDILTVSDSPVQLNLADLFNRFRQS